MSLSVERFQNSQWEKLNELNFSKRTILDMVKSGSVLDIGCGDGLLLEHLKNNGLVVSGIDISSTAINICKERGLDCIHGDISERLPFEDNLYDDVLLIDVLEHLFQPLDVLKEAERVSKKYVLISVPNFVSLPARIQVFLGNVPENNTPRDGHVYFMTLSVINSLLEKAGLKTEEIIVNTFWEKIPIIGQLMGVLKKVFPSLFALSFIIKAVKFKK
jgi:methionine biosynthesis protein MetW